MRQLALLVLLLPACASAPRPLPTSSEPEARAAIAQLLKEQYAAVERGDLDAWGARLDPKVFLFGSAPEEATGGRDALLAGLKKAAAGRMKSDVKRSYRSMGLTVGIAADRQAAWAADEIDYSLSSPAGERHIHFRMSALLGRQAGRWSILAAHYSVAVPHEQAFAQARAGQLPAPAPVAAEVAPGAEPLVELFRRGAAAPWEAAAWISDRPGVVLFGTAPDERQDGATARQTLASAKMSATLTVDDGVRAGLAPGGSSGRVAGNVRIKIGKLEIPFRTLEIFDKQGGLWRLVGVHSSIGVAD
jgi:hypothetical protein